MMVKEIKYNRSVLNFLNKCETLDYTNYSVLRTPEGYTICQCDYETNRLLVYNIDSLNSYINKRFKLGFELTYDIIIDYFIKINKVNIKDIQIEIYDGYTDSNIIYKYDKGNQI